MTREEFESAIPKFEQLKIESGFEKCGPLYKFQQLTACTSTSKWVVLFSVSDVNRWIDNLTRIRTLSAILNEIFRSFCPYFKTATEMMD
jgi:hypothetical protein